MADTTPTENSKNLITSGGIYNSLELKADKSQLDTKADKTELNAKADKAELNAKADKTELNAKYNSSNIESNSFTLSFGAGSTEFESYLAEQRCNYFKIGKMVTVNIELKFHECIKSESMSAYIFSYLTFNGLPYPCKSLTFSGRQLILSSTNSFRAYRVNESTISFITLTGIGSTTANSAEGETLAVQLTYITE